MINTDELDLDLIAVKGITDSIYSVACKGYYGFRPLRIKSAATCFIRLDNVLII